MSEVARSIIRDGLIGGGERPRRHLMMTSKVPYSVHAILARCYSRHTLAPVHHVRVLLLYANVN